MSRRVPWDNLPGSWMESHYAPKSQDQVIDSSSSEASQESSSQLEVPTKRNYMKELDGIGRRVAFGTILGAFSGASFAFFDILRDPKAMMEKSAASTAKVVRYSVCCAGFFSLYQGTRKTLKYNVKQTGEENVVTAAFISILPMGAFAMTRPLIPYCVCLVLIDAFNGVNDI